MSERRRQLPPDERRVAMSLKLDHALFHKMNEYLVHDDSHTGKTHLLEDALKEYLNRITCPRCNSKIPKFSKTCPFCSLELGGDLVMTDLLRTAIGNMAEIIVKIPEVSAWFDSCTEEEEARVFNSVMAELIREVRSAGRRSQYDEVVMV